MTIGALRNIALEPAGYRKGGGDKLHLLAPLYSEPLRNAGIAIHATMSAGQKVADPLWDRPDAHWDKRNEMRKS
jgi:hypothetical protein